MLQSAAEDCRNCDEDTLRTAGCAMGRMHMGLSGCRDTGGQDRFFLAVLLERATTRHSFLQTQNPVAQTLHQLAARLRPLEEARVQLIHGDLGVWNMLRTRDGGVFIDFWRGPAGTSLHGHCCRPDLPAFTGTGREADGDGRKPVPGQLRI